MKNVLITPEGIQKNLKNIKPLDAICEYIWNGFDAFATQVEIELNQNEMGLINMITISDNGCGINYDELKYKFQPFNDSKKANLSQKTNHTLPHGRKGIGRLTFFAFSQLPFVYWLSTLRASVRIFFICSFSSPIAVAVEMSAVST